MFAKGGGDFWAAVPTEHTAAGHPSAPLPESAPFLQHHPGFSRHPLAWPTSWTEAENRAFEAALVEFEEGGPNRWQRIAERVPGKTPLEVEVHYQRLEQDLLSIEAGVVELPEYTDDGYVGAPPTKGGAAGGGGVHISFGGSRTKPEERKKGIPWTEEEHRRFLEGLEKYGKGDWRSISRNLVVTRTPTQVASHAQKYFLRQSMEGKKERRRSSIHDVTRP